MHSYLTDYSGLGAAAATVGTILLLVGRILDAVDDPLQGWIMDSAPITEIGRYKPFMLGGILACSAALLMLFNVPDLRSTAAQVVGCQWRVAGAEQGGQARQRSGIHGRL